MRVFKRKRRDQPTGKCLVAGKYTVGWYDAFNDMRHEWPAYTDKATSEAFGGNLETLARQRSVNQVLAGDLAKWVESLTPEVIRRLVKIGLLDTARLAAGRPVVEHLADYKTWRDQKGRNESNTKQDIERIKRILDKGEVCLWRQITPTKIEKALYEIQSEAKLSVTTWVGYLAAFNAFLNWLVKPAGRAPHNPIAGAIERPPLEDGEHRRALEPDEARRLIVAAEAAPPMRGLTRRGVALERSCQDVPAEHIRWILSGSQRALLYRFAIETGLRRGAIGRLVGTDFHLDTEPVVTVLGKRGTKNRRTMRIPLRRETAALLKPHLAARLPTAPVFDMPVKTETAAMLRTDLAAARAAWIAEGTTAEQRAMRAQDDFLAATDSEGRRIDFHALRTTTGSWLDQAGVSSSIARRVTGHASQRTLERHYHRATDRQTRIAVEALPNFSPPALAATGTDGQMPTDLTANLTASASDAIGQDVTKYEVNLNDESEMATQPSVTPPAPVTSGWSVRR